MKRSGYKYQIEQELLKDNWEIVEIGSNEAWWDDEHWKIQFKHTPDISFYLCFIVDPMFEGSRKKGQGIYVIMASIDFPQNWNDDKNAIGSISMTKRKFDRKLQEFMRSIEKFKKNYPDRNP